jgi:DNA polymerase III epsilon subunit-like protein
MVYAIWGYKSTMSLEAVCERLDVPIELPQHRALPDAITTTRLLTKVSEMLTQGT